jgi:hypothetical protein
MVTPRPLTQDETFAQTFACLIEPELILGDLKGRNQTEYSIG